MACVFPGSSATRVQTVHGFLRCGMATALLLAGTLAAQTAPSDVMAPNPLAGACDALVAGTPHSDALSKVCQFSLTLPQRMPNFRCEQKTLRSVDDLPIDVITAIVTYVNGTESYQELASRGQSVSSTNLLGAGTWSTGQFGGDLRATFNGSNKVSFHYLSEGKLGNRRALIFQYRVAHQDVPAWQLQVAPQVVAPPYHGRLWVDESTGILLQFEAVTDELPLGFPMSNAELQIAYKDVPFGDGTSFVLPFRSVVSGDYRDGAHNRNVIEFHNCHKFRATAHILPE